MKTGISTACFYPMSVSDAVDYLIENGVTGCEVFFDTFSELKPEYTHELSKRCANAGMRVFAVHPFVSPMDPLMFFSEYTSRLADGIEQYKAYFEAAAVLGAKYVVFHGDRRTEHMEPKRAAERLNALGATAQAMGTTLLLENVWRCASGYPDYIKAVKELSGGLYKFNLDIKQARRADVPIEDIIDAMGIENIKHIHISDYGRELDCLSPGKGEFDFVKFCERLESSHYDGCLMIEVYHESYRDKSEVIESYRYINDIIERRTEEPI